MFGPATGKKVVFRAIADCYAINNSITDEWLVRDYGGIAKQLGWNSRDLAAKIIEDEGGPDKCTRPLNSSNYVEGPYKGRGNDNEWGGKYADTIHSLMSAELSVIQKDYDRAILGEYAGQILARGWQEVDRFWIGLRSSFPSAKFSINHQIGREDKHMPPRAALRWSLEGKHDGWGVFGKPTGADVYIMGMAHAEYGALVKGMPKIRKEYVLYDEVAIWKQILLKAG
jgi:hypothetical protein